MDFFATIPADTAPTAEELAAMEAASRDRAAAYTQEQKEEEERKKEDAGSEGSVLDDSHSSCHRNAPHKSGADDGQLHFMRQTCRPVNEGHIGGSSGREQLIDQYNKEIPTQEATMPRARSKICPTCPKQAPDSRRCPNCYCNVHIGCAKQSIAHLWRCIPCQQKLQEQEAEEESQTQQPKKGKRKTSRKAGTRKKRHKKKQGGEQQGGYQGDTEDPQPEIGDTEDPQRKSGDTEDPQPESGDTEDPQSVTPEQPQPKKRKFLERRITTAQMRDNIVSKDQDR